jgi:predicted NUDIX family NTP pyrophosphohydrolase
LFHPSYFAAITVRKSAGILLYRFRSGSPEFFLVHPGGPFWKNKDDGAWSIPKGEYEADEEPLAAARREFAEETGKTVDGPFIPLSPVKLKSGKSVSAWAAEGDLDASALVSNTIQIEWPPKSGRWQTIPEVDRGDWFAPDLARRKINPAQTALIDEFLTQLP